MTSQAAGILDCTLFEGANLQVRRGKPFILVIPRGEPGLPTSAVFALVGVKFSPEESAVSFQCDHFFRSLFRRALEAHFLIGALAPEVHGFRLPQQPLKPGSRAIAKCSAEALLHPVHQR